jgi:hypothetical protein
MQTGFSSNLQNAFLAHERIDGITCEHNDYVSILSGPYAGQKGSLVSIMAMEPEPSYTVESEAGMDINVKQSDLVLIARNRPDQ